MVNAHARITGDARDTINSNVLENCKFSFFLPQLLVVFSSFKPLYNICIHICSSVKTINYINFQRKHTVWNWDVNIIDNNINS